MNVQKTSMGTSETRHEEWGNLGLKGRAPGRDEKPPSTPPRVTRPWAPQAQEHQGPVGASEAQFYSVSEHPRISSSVLSKFWLLCVKRQRNTTQMKEQTRNTEVQINEEEIGKLPEKEFRIMIVKKNKA